MRGRGLLLGAGCGDLFQVSPVFATSLDVQEASPLHSVAWIHRDRQVATTPRDQIGPEAGEQLEARHTRRDAELNAGHARRKSCCDNPRISERQLEDAAPGGGGLLDRAARHRRARQYGCNQSRDLAASVGVHGKSRRNGHVCSGVQRGWAGPWDGLVGWALLQVILRGKAILPPPPTPKILGRPEVNQTRECVLTPFSGSVRRLFGPFGSKMIGWSLQIAQAILDLIQKYLRS